MEACENNHMETVLYLLRAGANATHKVNLTQPRQQGILTEGPTVCYTMFF